jgi:hypothetical protein
MEENWSNTVVLNHVNSDHIPSFSCLDVWTPWQTTSGVYAITATTSAYHSRIHFGEISIFHSRVMGLYSSNCRRFFVCCAVNWEPLRQFTSNFVLLLELIVFTDHYIIWICLQYMCIVVFFFQYFQKVCQNIIVFYFNINIV